MVAEICAPAGRPSAGDRTRRRSDQALLPRGACSTRLDRPLAAAHPGARDVPPRQRTMRDADRLELRPAHADEQALFRRLSVFAGGFTLDAAEADGSRDGATKRRPSPSSTIVGSLVEKASVNRVEHVKEITLHDAGDYSGVRLEQLEAHGDRGDAAQDGRLVSGAPGAGGVRTVRPGPGPVAGSARGGARQPASGSTWARAG